MKKHFTRGLSFLMTLCMVFSLFTCLGVGAFAEEGELELEAEETVVEEVAGEVVEEVDEQVDEEVNEEVVENAAAEEEVLLVEAPGCDHSGSNTSLFPVSGKDATCMDVGYKACYQCWACRDYFERTAPGTYKKINNYQQWKTGDGKIEKDPTNHTKNAAVEAKEPTCTETGLNATVLYSFYDRVGPIEHAVHYCSDCGHYYVVNILDRDVCANVDDLAIIPKDLTNHDMGDWEDDENGTTHTSTCLRDGCDYFVKADHRFVKGLCLDCGAEEPVTKVTVKFHGNAYGVQYVPADQQVDKGSKLAWPDTPVREGYDFYGWFTSSQCKPDEEWDFTEDTFEKDTDLYAKWVETYWLYYVPNGGTLDGMQPQGYMSNLPDPLATATREGYELEGWYYFDGSKAVPGAKMTSDTVLFAKWVKAHVCSKDTLTEVPEVPATCCDFGCKEYYTCTCGKNYTDKNAKNEIQNLTAWKATLSAFGGGLLVIDLENHATEPKLTAQLDPTCTETGLKAYYYCESCKLYFSVNSKGEIGTPIGEAYLFARWCKTEPTRETLGWGGLIPALDHDVQLAAERLEPTCLVAGHLAYYQCDRDGCKLYFYKLSDLAPVPEEELLRLDSATADEYGLIGDDVALAAWLAEGGDGYLEPLGHDWGDWEDNEDGTHSRVCKNDPSHVETEKHEYKDGECVDCGAEEPKPAKPAAPKTGDNGHALLWAAMALTMGCGATAIVLKKKHN